MPVISGSAFVPIYTSNSEEATRSIVAFYRDGRRIRRTFSDIEKASKEAKLAANRIQSGMVPASCGNRKHCEVHAHPSESDAFETEKDSFQN